MKNAFTDFWGALKRLVKNVSGSTYASGKVVNVNGIVGVCATDIANNGTGVVETAGGFSLTAQSGDTWSYGQPLAYDFTNSRLSTDITGGAHFIAAEDKTSGSTSARVFRLGAPVLRTAQLNRLATAGEDTANQVDWDTGFKTTPSFAFVYIINASNVCRLPAGAVTFLTGADAGKVRIVDANLAATERLVGFAAACA